MPGDSDPVVVTKKTDDLSSMFLDMFTSIRYKFVFIIFFSFLILQSDVFIGKILSKFDSATYAGYATSWGTIIQGVMLCGIIILLDGLISQKII